MLNKEIDRLYLLIGRIATDFSSIETIWYLIFTALIHQTPRPAADAIFHQIKTGYQQRQMIVAVANATLPKDSEALLSIRELAIRTRTVAERRNAVLHSAIYIMEAAIPPHIAAMGISKRSPLADKDIAQEIADLYRTVAHLELDMHALRFRMIKSIDPKSDLEANLARVETERLSLVRRLETDSAMKPIER
jgi:hypothetical protein